MPLSVKVNFDDIIQPFSRSSDLYYIMIIESIFTVRCINTIFVKYHGEISICNNIESVSPAENDVACLPAAVDVHDPHPPPVLHLPPLPKLVKVLRCLEI